jgi:hypothetical protein
VSTNARRIDAVSYRFRLIRPAASSAYTVLGQPYEALSLPSSHVPGAPDFAEGTYSTRDGDAGEFSITFPNAANSEGYLYRELFDPDGDRQFLEIWQGRELEFVGVVQRVDVDRAQVSVSGPDASGLLRKAYERDLMVVMSPTEAVRDYSRLWAMLAGDDFTGAALSSEWSQVLVGPSGGTVTSLVGGRFRVTESVGGQTVELRTTPSGAARSEWEFRTTIATAPRTGDTWSVALEARATGPGETYRLELNAGVNQVQVTKTGGTAITPPGIPANAITPCTLTLEARGKWVRAFLDGRLVAHLPNSLTPDQFAVQVFLSTTQNLLELEQVTLLSPEPFLQEAGYPGGDWASPVDLPYGGLRGSYFNDSDISLSTAGRRFQTLNPAREPFLVRVDKSVDTQGSGAEAVLWPPPGSAVSGYWTAIRWAGWVYIDAGSGTSTTFNILTGNDSEFRAWWTNFDGTPYIDRWLGSGTANPTVTLFHNLIGGRDGWYPILVETIGNIGKPELTMGVTPDHAYTDPGGTAFSSGVNATVPSTSLSPAGLVEGRLQGQSHFDLAYGSARDFGFQMRLLPYPLESGMFPGRLEPVHRLGRDTDVLLVEEEDEKGEPILTPGRTLDSSDQAVRLRGSANGLNGNRGNVTAEVIDVTAAKASLFVPERWLDAGDISDEAFLAARLASELSLVGSPWEEVRGTPLAQDRLADTWPLSGALAAMRWEPGDGIRVRVRDVGIDDVLPRRITQVTRSFGAEGRTGATVAFRNRPRGTGPELRRLLRAQSVAQRSVNVQLVMLPGEYALSSPIAAGTFGAYSRVAMMPGDELVRAYVRVVISTGLQSLRLEVNGTDRTGELGGPWIRPPLEIDITAFAVISSAHDSRVYTRLFNEGAVGTTTEHQTILEVIRRR